MLKIVHLELPYEIMNCVQFYCSVLWRGADRLNFSNRHVMEIHCCKVEWQPQNLDLETALRSPLSVHAGHVWASPQSILFEKKESFEFQLRLKTRELRIGN